MPPGTKETHDLAGALERSTGTLPHGRGPRTTPGRFRERRQRWDDTSPAPPCRRVSVVGDHDQIHHASAVEPWRAHHPRVAWLLWPTSGPRAHPLERAVGEVHALCPRHHLRKRWRALVTAVEAPLKVNGPWQYHRSALDDEPAVTAAVEHIAAEEPTQVAA